MQKITSMFAGIEFFSPILPARGLAESEFNHLERSWEAYLYREARKVAESGGRDAGRRDVSYYTVH